MMGSKSMPAYLAPGYPQSLVMLRVRNEPDRLRHELLEVLTRADEAASRVAAKVLQLGVFAVMEYVPSGELFARDEVYTYPNPAKGDSLTFKFRVSEKSYVKIDVYDIAGQKVARLEKAGCPAGVTSEIPWNIRKTASGVYQFRFEATGASGKKSVVKRLAIVH